MKKYGVSMDVKYRLKMDEASKKNMVDQVALALTTVKSPDPAIKLAGVDFENIIMEADMLMTFYVEVEALSISVAMEEAEQFLKEKGKFANTDQLIFDAVEFTDINEVRD